VIEPGGLLTQNEQPFRVYSAFVRAWRKASKPAPVRKVTGLSTFTKNGSEPLSTLAHWDLRAEAEVLPGGESAARKRQENFLNGPILNYNDRRDFPADSATSRLSQDLRFGLLSPRELYALCAQAADECSAKQRKHVDKYLDELIWREFCSHLLWHCPDLLDRDFNAQFTDLRWDWDPAMFQRWCEGMTGFPIVDAGMPQLSATGFMHNRVRMIVAMFLAKDLHIHWRRGESYFMRKLVDGDIAANRRMAVERWYRRRRRALLSNSESVHSNHSLRSRRTLYQAVGIGARRRRSS
jgi:deoxyribodipyrimidine photo-lyase